MSQFACKSCGQNWNEVDEAGRTPTCPSCFTPVGASMGGWCSKCGRTYDQHHWNMTKGSYEMACPRPAGAR